MPTYDYQCEFCGRGAAITQSIRAYCQSPIRPTCGCHGEETQMGRKLSVNPAMSGLANALAGDRHYDGMRATDGTDISTRSKHREYMKANGLTTADDFKQAWASAAKDREASRAQGVSDAARKAEIREQVMRAVAQPD